MVFGFAKSANYHEKHEFNGLFLHGNEAEHDKTKTSLERISKSVTSI